MTDDKWYLDTIQVGEFGMEVGLWTCLECGSLVRGLFKETHEKWHREVQGE
jgi:hypothetical protein